jgi:plastocyanin
MWMMRARTSSAAARRGSLALALVVVSGGRVLAQERSDAAETARLRADVTRLQQEVRELRQLIMQAVQNDQQHFDMLFNLLKSREPGTSGALPATPPASRPLPGAPSPPETSAAPAVQTATITGQVRAEGKLGEAYVYVDGLKSAPVRNRTIEIRQKDKRFVPAAAVVQVGTRAVFPNFDTVIHNVFSNTPEHSFDLGTVKGGERTSPIPLLTPGHVEVYCNIHSKMRADLLVVPNRYWTRVAADGSFQIANVPVGNRKLVLWGASLTPTSQQVEVTPRGASVTVSAAQSVVRPHLNKQGQPYGSYE